METKRIERRNKKGRGGRIYARGFGITNGIRIIEIEGTKVFDKDMNYDAYLKL